MTSRNAAAGQRSTFAAEDNFASSSNYSQRQNSQDSGLELHHSAIFVGKHSSENGVALILTFFILLFTSLLVYELSRDSIYSRTSARIYAEQIQSRLIAKSAINMGRVLLEIPKIEYADEDWLGDIWSQLGSLPKMEVEGISATSRVMIEDLDGKIDLNWLVPPDTSLGGHSAGFPDQEDTQNVVWLKIMNDLFDRLGFIQESWDANSNKTVGNVSFSSPTQVAVLRDWLDRGFSPFSSPDFNGEGMENQSLSALFFNRHLYSLPELLMVPGFTQERVSSLSGIVKVEAPNPDRTTTQGRKININTAPLDVLVALGFSNTTADNIISERTAEPISKEKIQVLCEGDQNLQKSIKVNSSMFAVYAKVEMPNTVTWLRAQVSSPHTTGSRRTSVIAVEIY